MIDQEYKNKLESELSPKQLIAFNRKIIDFLGKSYKNQNAMSFDNKNLFPRNRNFIYETIIKNIDLYNNENYFLAKEHILLDLKEIETICFNFQNHIEKINTLSAFADNEVASKETCEYYLELFNQIKYTFALILEEINTSKIKLKDIFDEIKR